MTEEQAAPQEQNPLDSWSQQDKDWLEKNVPAALQPIAIRHGRKLFELVMMVGASNYALEVLMKHNAGNAAVKKAGFVLGQTLNTLGVAALLNNGLTGTQFEECKEDVERMGALADSGAKPAGANVSKGGIILNS